MTPFHFLSNPRFLFRGYLHFITDAEQVAKNPKVSQFDCGALTENILHALNQVRHCHITPEELSSSQTKIILYIELFRKKTKGHEISSTESAREGVLRT